MSNLDMKTQDEFTRIVKAKREWHRRQALLPLREKVRILLTMQQQDYPLLKRRRKMESWEQPWNIEP
jgi:hypothetical protein